MKLVLAEKPSVAMSLSKVIGANQRGDGYMEGNGILFIIGFRLGKFHQMPHTPTDKVAIALHITVPALICPDHFRETHGNRGLFR